MTFVIGKAHLTFAMGRMNALMIKKGLQVSEMEHHAYLELRNIAFSLGPEQLGLKITNGSNKVYGIISDIANYSEASTVVTFLNGHASIYLSSSKGFIGSRWQNALQGTVREFMGLGNSVFREGIKIEHPLAPKNGSVNFYFLTEQGLTKISECISKLENGRSKYTNLYSKLKEVTKEIKLNPLHRLHSSQIS